MVEEQLAQPSRNSHRPPSQDRPKAKAERPRGREKSGKKRGGQKGHEGSQRDLLPREQVDHVEAVVPEVCDDCGAVLTGTDPHPQRHQVTELSVIRPVVTEYELHALDCAHCGSTTRAGRPNGAPAGAFGPRLTALVGYLTASCRLSKVQAQTLLRDVLGIAVSTGAISTMEARTSAAVQELVEAARAHVQQQATAYLDETRWWVAGVTAWLWVAVTKELAVFAIRDTRGKKVAKELLGETFSGTAITDRYSAYAWIDPLRHQVCWAHLVRDFRKMSMVHDPEAATLGQRLSICACLVFHDWKRVGSGELQRSSFRTYASAVRKDIRQLLRQGPSSTTRSSAACAARCSASSPRCGPSCVSKASNRRTTTPNASSGTA